MSEFRITEWSDDAIPELLELSQLTLGSSGAVIKSDAFWRWKHCANPFGRSYGVYTVDEKMTRIAAMRLLLRWAFVKRDGMRLTAARAVDTATHPDYQRRGLFSALTQRAITDLSAEGVGTIYNTPNEKSYPGYLKMGWSLVDRRELYLKPLRPMRMAARRLRPVSDSVAGSPDAYFRQGALVPWPTFVEKYGEDVWRLVSEWERMRVSTGWRTPRTQAYYSWRYGQHPHVSYYVYGMESEAGGSLTGMAIVRPNVRYGWQEAVLCEMALAEASAEAGRRLLRGLGKALRADYVIAHFAPGAIEYESVRRSGFIRLRGRGVRFTVRPLHEAYFGLSDPASWDLSLGDLEVF